MAPTISDEIGWPVLLNVGVSLQGRKRSSFDAGVVFQIMFCNWQEFFSKYKKINFLKDNVVTAPQLGKLGRFASKQNIFLFVKTKQAREKLKLHSSTLQSVLRPVP
jgi:hypothetical protein